MATIQSKKEVQTFQDSEGNITQTIVESTTEIQKLKEPDFIKVYTNMWCEFNKIPITWRPLFIELVSRMTYCNSKDLEHSQIVQTGSIFGEAIQNSLNIGQRQYQKGLKVLVECGAIRKIQNRRGIYQINPNYAGRGEWKYNPKLARGGIEDLKATFGFKNHTVNVEITWADDGTDNKMNQIYRNGLNVKSENNTVMKTITQTN